MLTLADSNLWLALTLSRHRFHHAARQWLTHQQDGHRLLLCRATQQSFLRLLTTNEVLAPYGIPPLTNAKAWATIDGWLTTGFVVWVEEPSNLENNWRTLTGRDTASPKLWMDAYLAAFAMSGGYRLATIDRGFKQFRGLNLELVSAE